MRARNPRYSNLVKEYASGLSVRDLAARYGVSYEAMRKALLVRGVVMREQGRNYKRVANG